MATFRWIRHLVIRVNAGYVNETWFFQGNLPIIEATLGRLLDSATKMVSCRIDMSSLINFFPVEDLGLELQRRVRDKFPDAHIVCHYRGRLLRTPEAAATTIPGICHVTVEGCHPGFR